MFQGRKFKCLTLIELVIAVSISVLLLAVSIPLFTKEKGRDRTRSEAELVAGFIDKARNLAVHPDSENATAYRVEIKEASTNVVNIIRLEKNNGVLVDSLNLNDYRIDNITPPVDFYVFSGEFIESRPTEIIVKDGRNQSSITISPPGVINVL